MILDKMGTETMRQVKKLEIMIIYSVVQFLAFHGILPLKLNYQDSLKL